MSLTQPTPQSRTPRSWPLFSRRRALGAVPLLALTGTALVACNPAASTRREDAKGLRFSWWGNAERQATTEEIIDLFETAHPDIPVATEPGDIAGYWDKLNSAVAAGDEPDVITMGGAYPAEYAQRGLLLDLGTVSEQLDLSVFDESALSPGTVDGTVVAVPTGINAPAMIMNPAVLEAAGITPPDTDTWTWQDYIDICAAVTEASPEGTYGSGTTLTHDSLDLWARQHGQNLYTEDGQLGLEVGTVESFFQLAKDLVDSGAAPSADRLVELTDVSTEQTLMGTGQAAFAATWSSSLTPLSDAAGEKLQLVPLPGESEEPGAWLQPSQMFTISARTASPEDAALLVSFLLTDPEAGRLVLTDRGVPAVAAQREAILPELSETAQAEVAYIDDLSARELKPTWIGPAGSTAIEEITPRQQQEVLFGRATPAEAAAAWFEEASAAITDG